MFSLFKTLGNRQSGRKMPILTRSANDHNTRSNDTYTSAIERDNAEMRKNDSLRGAFFFYCFCSKKYASIFSQQNI